MPRKTECFDPAATCMILCPRRHSMLYGCFSLRDGAPFPSCPCELQPQEYTSSSVQASVWFAPTAMLRTLCSGTRLGMLTTPVSRRLLIGVASKLAVGDSATSISPERWDCKTSGGTENNHSAATSTPTLPVSMRASSACSSGMPISSIVCTNRWFTRRDMRLRSLAERFICTVLASSVESGSPSCPWLMSPQVNMNPLDVNAALCESPAASWRTGRAQSPFTSEGDRLLRTSPRPSCPLAFSPQAYTRDVAVTHIV
mmetsp:Transcript_2011/g.6516  ORF Transcript_2011/g.6516 Transcript_2011/m.6516 type:complete len:257 (-) Transcript_2011:20-790(-)